MQDIAELTTTEASKRVNEDVSNKVFVKVKVVDKVHGIRIRAIETLTLAPKNDPAVR